MPVKTPAPAAKTTAAKTTASRATASRTKAAKVAAAEIPSGVSAEPTPVGPRAADLLAWYDRHGRDLPWRAKPGESADPYRVWLSEIMLQQTTVTAVRPYFARFLTLFPDVVALAEAPSESVMGAWAGLGYYSRARNLHACAKAVAAGGGRFPETAPELRRLPGIGPYTAAAVAAIAFGQAEAAVDGNVERVVSRLHLVETPLPAGRAEIAELTLAMVPADRPGDFAQALMDLGATICTPRRPACALCPWMAPCRARAAGTADLYPRKVKKRDGIVRRGAAFVLLRSDNAVLLRTRPPKGLLGGMAEVPGSDWTADYDPAKAVLDAPVEARWRRLPGEVRHVFTHFPLELAIFFARGGVSPPTPDGMRWTPRDELDREPLPALMKKVLEHALGTVAGPARPAPKVSPSPRSGPARGRRR